MKKPLLFRLPLFSNQQETNAANVLQTLIWCFIIIVTFFLGLQTILIPALVMRAVGALLAVLVAGVVSLIWTRRGSPKLAGMFLVFQLWLLVSVLAYTGGGIRAPGITTYLIIVAIAGLVLGMRAALLWAIICSATELVLVYLNMKGMLPPSSNPQYEDFHLWIFHTMFLTLLIILEYLSIRSIPELAVVAHGKLTAYRKFPPILMIIFLLISIGIVAAGYYYFKSQEGELVRLAENNLSAVANLKERQIENWRSERVGDANVISENVHITEIFGNFLKTPSNSRLRDGLLEWLESIRRNYNYDGIAFYSAKGKLVLHTGKHVDEGESDFSVFFNSTVQSKRVLFSEIQYNPNNDQVFMNLFCPLLEKNKQTPTVAGIIVLRMDPRHFLFPLIESWPSASRTSESFLVRRDDDSVLFLNELRHEKNTAMRKRIPITSSQIPAVKAAQGLEGIIRGIDYRGVPVFAAIRKTSNFSWYIVAKTDEAEVYEALEKQKWTISIMVTILFLAAAGAIGVFWQRNTAKFYRRQYELETERKRAEETLHESEEQYRTLFDRMMDGMYRSTHEGRFVDLNPAMVKMFGYTSKEEMLKVDIKKELYFAAEDRESHFLDDGKEKVEIFNMRSKDGSKIWVEDHGRYIHDVHGNVIFHEGILRDVTERKRAEEALQESEERFRSLAEAGFEGIMIHERGVILAANKVFTNLFGYPDAKDLIGKNGLEILPLSPESRDKLQASMRQGLSKPFEIQVVRPDGTTFPAETQSRAIIYRERQVRVVAMRDITDRKRAEEMLRQSEERFRTLAETATDAIVTIDQNSKILFVNAAIEKVFGYRDTELIGQQLTVLMPEYMRHVHEVSLKRYLDTGKKHISWEAIELPGLHRSGKEIPLEVSFGEFRKNDSHFFTGIIRDITERKRAKEELKQSEERYKSLFEDVLTGAFISTPQGQLLACNPAYARIFRFSSVDEALKTDPASLYREPLTRQSLLTQIQKNKKIENVELEMVRKDGTTAHILANVVGKFNDRGELIQIQGYFFDDTQRRELQQQLMQAQKLDSLGTLAGGIAHDFNNILGIIMGYASFLVRHEVNSAKLSQNAESIIKAASRGAALVKQLLTFARKTEIFFGPVQINDTIEEITKLVGATFPKTVVISTQLQENLPPITADGTQIHQVILNLCINARDALSKSGTISISTRTLSGESVTSRFLKAEAPEYVQVQISDTGTGMDAVTRQKIFEPFFTTKGPGKGTGLGLALVYGIVESHKGFIDVESELGRGTTFSVFLPVHERRVDGMRIAQQSTKDVPGGNETILIIEDEEMLRELVKATLASVGYAVLTAQDGEEGVEAFSHHQREVSAVITDLGLPKLSGEEVFKRIRAIDPRAKVIVASGFIDPVVKSEMFKAGVKNFIQKPYLPNEVLSKIRDIIDAGE